MFQTYSKLRFNVFFGMELGRNWNNRQRNHPWSISTHQRTGFGSGYSHEHGIRAYFEYTNSLGGVNGRKLSLVLADDGYEATRTAENTKKLIE